MLFIYSICFISIAATLYGFIVIFLFNLWSFKSVDLVYHKSSATPFHLRYEDMSKKPKQLCFLCVLNFMASHTQTGARDLKELKVSKYTVIAQYMLSPLLLEKYCSKDKAAIFNNFLF